VDGRYRIKKTPEIIALKADTRGIEGVKFTGLLKEGYKMMNDVRRV
jgi:hypothetical protein